ncbi:MAG: O-antigen ligase domain-containing protein [Spartobacteria bacterium]|nr:O-antigen ligase domain-containing protein [Spartobacteria bacterium]
MKYRNVIFALLLFFGVSVFWMLPWNMIDYFESPKRAFLGLLPFFLLVFSAAPRKYLPYPALGRACVVWMIWTVVAAYLSPLYDAEVLHSAWLPFLFLLAAAFSTRRTCSFLAMAVVASGVFQMVVMWGQRMGIDFLTSTGTADAASMIGTIGYHNHAASFLFLAAGVSWFYPWERGGRPSFVILLTGLMMAGTATATGCRGAFFGWIIAIFAVGVLLFLTGRITWRNGWIYGGGLIGCAALLGVPVWHRVLQFSMNDPQFGLSSRFIMWKAAVRVFAEHPVIGNGPGGFACHYMRVLAKMLPAEKSHALLQSLVYAREPHNDYLLVLTDYGVIGAGILAVVLWLYIRALSRAAGSLTRSHRMLGCFTLVYMGIHALLSFPWFYPVSGPVAGMMLGMALCNDLKSEKKSTGLYLWLLLASLGLALLGLINAWNHAFLLCDTYPLHSSQLRSPRMATVLGSDNLVKSQKEDGYEMLAELWVRYRDPLLCNNLGAIYSDREQWDAALNVYRFWEQTGLLYSQAQYNVATTLEAAGRYDQADAQWAIIGSTWRDADWHIAAKRVDCAMKQKNLMDVLTRTIPYVQAAEYRGVTYPYRLRDDDHMDMLPVHWNVLSIPVPVSDSPCILTIPDHRSMRYAAATVLTPQGQIHLDLSSFFHRSATMSQAAVPRPVFDDVGFYFPTSGVDNVSIPLPDQSAVHFDISSLMRVTNNCSMGPLQLELPAHTSQLYILGCAVNAPYVPKRIQGNFTVNGDSSLPVCVQFSDWTKPIDEGWETNAAALGNQLHMMNFAAAAYLMLDHPEQAQPIIERILSKQPQNAMARRNLELINIENH